MYWELIIRLLIAAMLGAVIGLNREYRAKEAGFRTHFLVSLGSCLFMLVSQYGFADILGDPRVGMPDPSRVAAQIVTGVGFLGAGTIIFHKRFIRGLTTAAGLWAAAGIGMAVGGGLYVLGIVSTLLVLAGLELFSFIFKNVGMHSLHIGYSTTEKGNLAKIVDEVHRRKFLLVSYGTQQEEQNGHPLYKASMSLRVHKQKDINALFSFIQAMPDTTLTAMD